MNRYVFGGGTALVTGAASGIGEAVAVALAAKGSDLILVDRDSAGLDKVAGAIRADTGRAVSTHVVDLADPAALRELADTVLAEQPALRLLVNNAGVALGGRFDQIALADFDWVLDINLHAVVRLTHALLPALKSASGAHVVNVSSLFGLIAPAGQTAYSASKFGVRGFTEALRHELADDGIGVTSVHPGGIRTKIAENARIGGGVSAQLRESQQRQWEKLLTIDPAEAAARIVDGIDRRRPRVLIGWSARLPDLFARVLPGNYWTAFTTATALLRRFSR